MFQKGRFLSEDNPEKIKEYLAAMLQQKKLTCATLAQKFDMHPSVVEQWLHTGEIDRLNKMMLDFFETKGEEFATAYKELKLSKKK